MESTLDEYVSEADLKKSEKAYNEALKNGDDNTQEKFDYATCLICSRYVGDIEKGLHLLGELYKDGTEEMKRDCMFYLAVGKTKLRDYNDANCYIKGFLEVEPNNQQALDLKDFIKKNLITEGVITGAAVVGAIGAGALLGAGLIKMFRHRHSSQDKK